MTDYDPVKPIRNRKNFVKYASFYYEPCASALLQVYQWLYKRTGSPKDIVDHYKSFAINNIFQNWEKKQLEEIKNNPSKIKEFDITLLYKLIIFGTDNDQVVSLDKCWSRKSPPADKSNLAYLLFLVKESRNDIAHVKDSLKNLTDNDVTDECNNLIDRLSSIIQQSGHMASIEQSIIDNIEKCLKEDLERIRDEEEGQFTNLTTLLRFIKEDLVFSHKEDLERSFENELRGYCPPNFVLKADQSYELRGYCPPNFVLKANQSVRTTEDLLPSLKSQTLIVDGESGMGKTSFTKYLFRCWLFDETEELDLSSYEVIFRIDCRSLPTSDISQFLEDHLPNAHQYWSNTESLKKHLKKLKVLWIMDGFDESTPAFILFIESHRKNLSCKHKIVITTRPDCLDELEKKLPKYATEATLKPFTSVQVLGDAKKYLKDETKFDEFNQFYENLSNETRKLMETPGNLNLCLYLWSCNPDELKGEFTMHKLYEKISLMQINQLVERHRGKTNNVIEDDLKSHVEKWFYDVLCKLAAESFINFKFTIRNDEQECLKDEARKLGLLENYCLSTFLNAEQSHEGGLRYVYRHRTQQEVLASLYLKKSKDDKILELFEVVDPLYFVLRHLKEIIDMLVKTCNGSDLVQISDLFLDQTRFMKYRYKIQSIWRGIFRDANGDEEFRKAFRTKVSSWPKPFKYYAYLCQLDLDDLESLIDCLLPDVSKFDIDLSVHNFRGVIRLKDALRNLIEVFKRYENKISFGLNLNIDNSDTDLLNILKQEDYHKWVKKIAFSDSYFDDLNVLFDFPNLMEIHFHNYDMVSQLALNSSGDHYLHPSCVANFDLSLENNWIEQLSFCLSVSKKFCKVTFELYFYIRDDYKDLPEEMGNDVISKCISSLHIKELNINFEYAPLNCILFRLINTLKLEKVRFDVRDSSNTLDFENLFKLWNCSDQKDLKEVEFDIKVKKLKSLYEHIPMNLIDITSVDLNIYDDGTKEDIPEYNGKKFKNIKYKTRYHIGDWRYYVSPEINECFNHLRQSPWKYSTFGRH